MLVSRTNTLRHGKSLLALGMIVACATPCVTACATGPDRRSRAVFEALDRRDAATLAKTVPQGGTETEWKVRLARYGVLLSAMIPEVARAGEHAAGVPPLRMEQLAGDGEWVISRHPLEFTERRTPGDALWLLVAALEAGSGADHLIVEAVPTAAVGYRGSNEAPSPPAEIPPASSTGAMVPEGAPPVGAAPPSPSANPMETVEATMREYLRARLPELRLAAKANDCAAESRVVVRCAIPGAPWRVIRLSPDAEGRFIVVDLD